MITIISGSNRKANKSLDIAKNYSIMLDEIGIENQIFSLNDLPSNMIHEDMYTKHSDEIIAIYNKYIEPVKKYVFVIPEYNGSFPGVLKIFMDSIPPAHFENTKAGLIGLSAGRAGNTRGTDQFTNVLNYLKVAVHFSKPKLSEIHGILNSKGEITNENTKNQLRLHAKMIAEF